MRFNKTMWVVQGLLAALFLFAGGMKLVMPVEAMQQGPLALPGPFLRFIGVAEVAGAFGLVLPGALRIRAGLTPLAAAGLLVIMVGAVTITVASMGPASAMTPLIVGLMLTVIAYGRTRNVFNVRSAATA